MTGSKTILKKPPTKLKCPSCRRGITWSDDFPYRPFCSKRCQQLDFSDWAMEKNRIPGNNDDSGVSSEDLDSEYNN